LVAFNDSVCGDTYAIEVVRFKGHKNVRATHKTTLEITRDPYLTIRGDCIVGVLANKALKDFSLCFKELARKKETIIIMVLIVDEVIDFIKGSGGENLTYSDDRKIIARKSTYQSPNTVMINADKAAVDIKREMISLLRDGENGIALFIELNPKNN
jgi:hypothetical protein